MSVAGLLLADSRFPTGGSSHSFGVEEAVTDGRILDLASLRAFLDGRLRTSGVSDAAIAAAVVIGLDPDVADAEADARIASPALRAASRALGRQLLRSAAALWPVPPRPVHVSVATGLVARAAGLSATDTARLVLYQSAASGASAAIRLLGLDPVLAQGLVLTLPVDELVSAAVAATDGPVEDLPGGSLVLVDIGAEAHRSREVRLFAS